MLIFVFLVISGFFCFAIRQKIIYVPGVPDLNTILYSSFLKFDIRLKQVKSQIAINSKFYTYF